MVNFDDLLILGQNYDLPGTFDQGDLNYSGQVDYDDLLILSQQYNKTMVAADTASFALNVTSEVNADVTVSWSSAGISAAGFVVYRSDDGQTFSPIKTIAASDALYGDGTTYSYTDQTPNEGTPYIYRVRSYHVVNGQMELSTATASKAVTTLSYAPVVKSLVRVDATTAYVEILDRSGTNTGVDFVAVPVGGGTTISLSGAEGSRMHMISGLVSGVEYLVLATAFSSTTMSSAGLGIIPAFVNLGDEPLPDSGPEGEPTTKPVLGDAIALAPPNAEIITGPRTKYYLDGTVLWQGESPSNPTYRRGISKYETQWEPAGPSIQIPAGQNANGLISWTWLYSVTWTLQAQVQGEYKAFSVTGQASISATNTTASQATTNYNIPADPKGRAIVIVPVKEVLRRRTTWYAEDGTITYTSTSKLGGPDAGDATTLDMSHSYLAYYL